MVLESEKSTIKAQTDPVSDEGPFLFLGGHPLCPYLVGGQGSSLGCLLEVYQSPPKAHPNTITLAIRFQHINFEEDTKIQSRAETEIYKHRFTVQTLNSMLSNNMKPRLLKPCTELLSTILSHNKIKIENT